MQKSTLHLGAYGTIQTVTVLDAEVREILFRTCTALCYENDIIKTASRTGPEAFFSPSLFAMRNNKLNNIGNTGLLYVTSMQPTEFTKQEISGLNEFD